MKIVLLYLLAIAVSEIITVLVNPLIGIVKLDTKESHLLESG